MRTLLLWLCIHPVYTVFEGTCPRKDPPPGVLVLSPGSKLVLTCSGHMKVDGVSVGVIGESSTANTRRKSSSVTTTTQKYTSKAAALIRSDNSSVRVTTSSHLTKTQTSSDSGENRSLRYAEAGFTLSPHMDPAARPSTSLQRESDWEPQSNLKGEGDNKVTRGIKLWKWNKNRIGAGDKDWEDVTFGRSGDTLTLASVRPADSGKYTCYHKKRENFAVKVIVADPPERPSLSCYKKSPSSKIRCEWSAQKPITKHPDCYLLLSKGLSYNFSRVLCSYLSHHARCWCALDYNEDELRTPHVAFLCVTSMTQNATSSILNFTPLDILRPDPPSNVSVQQKEGQERRMKISWNFPLSWKQQDQFYYLIYEIKYRPVSGDEDQIIRIKVQRSYTITDVIPGIKYVIQLRSKEEYDGQWSQWSTPVYAQTWNAKLNPPSKVSVQVEEGQETMMTVTWISPTDWKHEDCHHELIYEIKYQILGFLIDDGQTRTIKGHCIYTITDVIPGAEYMIQVRTKKGHGGDWSDWSTPVYAGSWTTPGGDRQMQEEREESTTRREVNPRSMRWKRPITSSAVPNWTSSSTAAAAKAPSGRLLSYQQTPLQLQPQFLSLGRPPQPPEGLCVPLRTRPPLCRLGRFLLEDLWAWRRRTTRHRQPPAFRPGRPGKWVFIQP
ncbi:interleukin-6 receptor subunit alpha isoform 2-T3 [Pholidichthys leucotaenia]